MKRRRLIVAAAIAATLGAGWWWFATTLSTDERRLVGAWRMNDADKQGGDRHVMIFAADGSAEKGNADRPTDPLVIRGHFRWSVRNGALVADLEPSALRRQLRPVAGLIGLTVRPAMPYRLEWATEDEFVLTSELGTGNVWVRASAD
jgi:hypothetical protein